MKIPPFLSAVAGKGPLRVELVKFDWENRFNRRLWYHLVGDGEKFPLAGGPIGFIMDRYRGIAGEYLARHFTD